MLGGQVVVTVISALFLRKLPLTFSQTWLFNRLKYYRCPTDQELRTAAGSKVHELTQNGLSGSVKGQKRRSNKKCSPDNNGGSVYPTYSQQHFSFPKSTPVELHLHPVEDQDIISWKYWVELKWIFDYALMTCLVVALGYLYAHLLPLRASKEFNLSIVWLLIGWLFTVQSLARLICQFFKATKKVDAQSGDETTGVLNHEAFICLSAAAFNFLLTCFVLILTPPNWLDFQFQTGCDQLVSNLDTFFSNISHKVDWSSSEEFWHKVTRCKNVNVLLIGSYGFVLALVLTFPLIRLARVHQNLVIGSKLGPKLFPHVSKTSTVVSHLNLIVPLIYLALCLRPFGVNIFHSFLSPRFPRLDAASVWTIVLCALLLSIVSLKLLVLPTYLRVYLWSVIDKTDSLLCQAGNISNVQYQKLVASHNYYACVAALQLAAPAIMLLFQTAMLLLSTDLSFDPKQSALNDEANQSNTFRFIWKLIPVVLCHNTVKAAIFIYALIHCEMTAFGMLLNFSVH